MKINDLRFRAWDGQTMNYSDDGDYRSLEAFFALTDDQGYGSFRTEYMRWTGLIDSSGKNIYEGDIIQWFDLDDPQPLLVIKWAKTFSNFAFSPYDLSGEPYDFYGGWPFGMDMARVIGNIYQNPELLKPNE
jgi:hypothetical protein